MFRQHDGEPLNNLKKSLSEVTLQLARTIWLAGINIPMMSISIADCQIQSGPEGMFAGAVGELQAAAARQPSDAIAVAMQMIEEQRQ